MAFFRNSSIRTKLKLVILSTSFLSVALVFAGFFAYEYVTFRELLVKDLATKADIVAENTTAALSFHDSSDASHVLHSLSSQPLIISAAIYDQNKNLFATYSRGNKKVSFPFFPEPEGSYFDENVLVLYKPILFNNSEVGTIYLTMDLVVRNERLRSYTQIAILVLIGSLAVAFVVATALERNISRPILDLANIAHQVSQQQDYSIRVPKTTEDETGFLADAMNQMLSQISERDANLQQTNVTLRAEIVERERTEQVLKESEERFRNLFENHPLPMWVYDLKTLKFLEVNDSAVLKYGYSHSDFLGMRITDISPAQDRSIVVQDLASKDLLEHSGPWKHLLKNGNVIDVEAFAHKTVYAERAAALVVTIEITDRLNAERELKTSEERYRSLISVMTSIVWTADEKGEFATPQESWERYTGQPWEEHHGLGWINKLHPEDRDRVLGAWKSAVRERTAFESGGRVWHEATHGYRFFIASAVPLLSPDETVKEWVGTFADIDEERRSQDEVRKLNEQLEARVLERTAQLKATNKELEAFSYSVSHDLRAPLRHIDGYAQLLAKNVGSTLNEKGKRYLQTISSSAQKLGILIDDLLVFSRMGRSEMRSSVVNLHEMVWEVIHDANPETSDRSIDWKVARLPHVKGDPSMLRLVLVNLVSNAVKYTRPRAHASIEIGFENLDRETVFYFKDNGVGFNMEYVGRLFGVFQRLHTADEFEGTGIGLANVRRIIVRHGGRTWAQGEIDKGATFYFSLPRAQILT